MKGPQVDRSFLIEYLKHNRTKCEQPEVQYEIEKHRYVNKEERFKVDISARSNSLGYYGRKSSQKTKEAVSKENKDNTARRKGNILRFKKTSDEESINYKNKQKYDD